MEAVLQSYAQLLTTLEEQTLANVPEDLCLERVPGEGWSEICAAEASAERGGAACNLVAKAFVAQERSADVAIHNAGGWSTTSCRSPKT